MTDDDLDDLDDLDNDDDLDDDDLDDDVHAIVCDRFIENPQER
jgi:hypothetical protein